MKKKISRQAEALEWPLYNTHFPFHNICFNLCEFSKWTE